MLGSEGSFERVFGWVCLFIVLGLFLSSYILSSMYILIPLIHSNTITIICCILLSISTISLCLSLVYYFKARFSNPGMLPRHFSEVPADLRKLEDPVYHQTCKKCKDAWKPPRAYHCKVCNTCIMKMDHHCVWISNCVGAGNSKAFLQFVSAAFVYNFSFAMATIVACLNVIGYLGGRKLIVYATVSDFELVEFYHLLGRVFPFYNVLSHRLHLHILHMGFL